MLGCADATGRARATRSRIGGLQNRAHEASIPTPAEAGRSLADTRRYEHVDEDKLETLKRWGAGLRNDGREEIRAAGRAILMLADEVDRLRLELANAREHVRAFEHEVRTAEGEARVEGDFRLGLDESRAARLWRRR